MSARALWVSASLFLVGMAFVLVRTGRDALYFTPDGLEMLPLAYLGIAASSLPLAIAALIAIRRIGPRPTRVAFPLVAGIAWLIASRSLTPGGGTGMTLFFVSVPILFGVIFSMFWLLAADLLDLESRARLARAYGVIGASAMAGGIVGGLGARFSSGSISPHDLVRAGSVLLVVAAIVVMVCHRFYPERPIGRGDPALPASVVGFRAAFSHRSIQLMFLIGLLGALVGVLIEFQFYLAAARSGAAPAGKIGFFASFYLLLNVASLAVQLLITPRLQDRLGVFGSLFVLPLTLLGLVTVLIPGGFTWSRSLLRITEGGVKASIHRSNWEQAYLGIQRPLRPLAKVLVDGAGARFGEGTAAGLIQAGLSFGFFSAERHAGFRSDVALGVATLLVLMVWITLTRRFMRSMPKPDPCDYRLAIPLPDT